MAKLLGKCDLCDEQFESKNKLDRHRQVIHKVKYGCDQCDRKYPALKSLKEHKNLVHGRNQYKCETVPLYMIRKNTYLSTRKFAANLL